MLGAPRLSNVRTPAVGRQTGVATEVLIHCRTRCAAVLVDKLRRETCGNAPSCEYIKVPLRPPLSTFFSFAIRIGIDTDIDIKIVNID